MSMPHIPFDIYALYAAIGFVCALVIGIIRNRTRATAYKDTVDRVFLFIMAFFMVFCVFDALWGIIGSQLNHQSPLLYEISTYMFHTLSAVSSFLVCFYGRHFLHLKDKPNKVILIYSIVLLAGQFALLFQNLGTHNFFLITEDGAYVPGELRTASFILQFLQYFPLALFACISAIVRAKKKKTYKLYLSGVFFLMIPLVFGVLQMLFPDGAFYSLGFAVMSVAIYAINVTKQREDYLADYHRIEEQKKSHDAISKALKVAEEANKAKSVFLANMSHDIRTPINGIMGMTELAKKEEMSDKAKDYINKIDTTSHHLLSLVNDVLDMSLIENKQNDLILNDEMNIKTIVNNCESILSTQLLDKDLEFNISYKTECKHSLVYGDELRLKQIFINILGNSIKFTPSKGRINFNISEVSFFDDHVKYLFEFSDTGCGMTEEFMEHLFEPFQQERNASRTKYVGTGLGMAITKQLVDLMGGTIEVESVINKGTTFRITIPFQICDKTIEDHIKTLAPDQLVDIKGMNIMVVEDNDLNMEIAVAILENNGAIVTQCVNGKEALEKFTSEQENSFDLILMDIMMPEMNGYEATKAIRASDKKDAKSIPIVAMTANAFETDKKNAALAGMNGHISKPIDFNLLIKEISKHMKRD